MHIIFLYTWAITAGLCPLEKSSASVHSLTIKNKYCEKIYHYLALMVWLEHCPLEQPFRDLCYGFLWLSLYCLLQKRTQKDV